MYICVYNVYYCVYLSKSSFFTGVSESLPICGPIFASELFSFFGDKLIIWNSPIFASELFSFFGDKLIIWNSSVVSASFSAGAGLLLVVVVVVVPLLSVA